MNEASMSSLDAQINRFRMMDSHASGCNSLAPQPKQEGFQYDYYVKMYCDCFLSLKNPTFDEKVKFVRHMAQHYGGVHTQQCNTSNPIPETYRDKPVWLIRNCTCWLSQVDKPVEPAYTGPMTIPEEQVILSEIKHKVDQTVRKALGPHLDTPIYDQLKREFDAKNKTTSYFDSALHEKVNRFNPRT